MRKQAAAVLAPLIIWVGALYGQSESSFWVEGAEVIGIGAGFPAGADRFPSGTNEQFMSGLPELVNNGFRCLADPVIIDPSDLSKLGVERVGPTGINPRKIYSGFHCLKDVDSKLSSEAEFHPGEFQQLPNAGASALSFSQSYAVNGVRNGRDRIEISGCPGLGESEANDFDFLVRFVLSRITPQSLTPQYASEIREGFSHLSSEYNSLRADWFSRTQPQTGVRLPPSQRQPQMSRVALVHLDTYFAIALRVTYAPQPFGSWNDEHLCECRSMEFLPPTIYVLGDTGRTGRQNILLAPKWFRR